MSETTPARPWTEVVPEEYFTVPLSNGEQAYVHKTVQASNVTVSRFTYISQKCVLGGAYPIAIGAFCSLAQEVYCWTRENHQTKYASTFPLQSVLGLEIGYEEAIGDPKGVIIGNDVWICSEVRIQGGVTIGNGCVVAARSIVTKDCEPYGIYAGSPAKLLRKRFPDAVIEQLQQIKWWDWPLEKIKRNAPFFSIDLENFTGSLAEQIVD